MQSVSRTLAALRCLNQNNGASPLQLSRSLNIPRATVYRILDTLALEGYVRKDEHTGGYWLEEKVYDLGCGFRRQDWILDDAEQIISDLYSEFHWCLMLSAPESNEMLIRVATLKRNLQGGQRSIAGRTLSMSSGPGLTYMAYCPQDEREKLLDYIVTHPKPFDDEEALSCDRNQILDRIDVIREFGYHIHNKLTRARSINVPVMRNNQSIGALSMTFFASSVKHQDLTNRYLPKLRMAAEQLGISADKS